MLARWTRLRRASGAATSCRAVASTCTRASSSSSADGSGSAAALPVETAEPLRVGIVGLGAIGTIFFSKLGAAVIAHASTATAAGLDASTPSVAVDALVKPQHFARLFGACKSGQAHIALHEPMPLDNDSDSKSDNKSKSTAAAATASGATQLTAQLAFQQHTEQLALATHSSRVRIRALTADSDRSDLRASASATAMDSPAPHELLDVVLVAVKAYDSAAAVQSLQAQYAHLLQRNALVVLLQNGLSDARLAAPRGCAWRFAHGVTYVGGRSLSLGHVLTSGVGAARTYVAPVANAVAAAERVTQDLDARRLDALCRALTAAGLCAEALSPAAMQTMQWRKLIVNAGINPIASILNAPNESVGACEWSRACVETVVREACAVAAKERVALECSEEELVREVLQVAANTGTNVCSMLADLRRGSRTEIEAITGRIVALGRTHSVATPANALLLQLVHALEAQQTRAEGSASGSST